MSCLWFLVGKKRSSSCSLREVGVRCTQSIHVQILDSMVMEKEGSAVEGCSTDENGAVSVWGW